MVSKWFLFLAASALFLQFVIAPPAPPPTPVSDENMIFAEAPPPCLQPRSKNKLPLVIFCLVMITILAFLLWMFAPGLRSLTSQWISQCIPRTGDSVNVEPSSATDPPMPTATPSPSPQPMPSPTATPSPSPPPMPSPTAPPLPSPPRVLSCPVCGYPHCLAYVSCPFCGKPAT